MRQLSFHCVFLLLLVFQVHSESIKYCDANVFGRPMATDCIAALSLFPAASLVADLYLEQQIRGVSGSHTNWNPSRLPSMRSKYVQLPKIWTLRSCTIALVSFKGRHHTVTASVTTSQSVERSVAQLVHDCTIMGRAGGVKVTSDVNGREAVSSYIFDSISPFNTAFNLYQSMDFQIPIDPLAPLASLHLVGSTGSSNGNETLDGRTHMGMGRW